MAELHDLAGFGAHLEPGRPGPRGTMRDNPVVTVDLGAILGAVGAISPVDRHQPLPVHAEAIIGIIVDAADRAVLRQCPRTTPDRWQARERPADAEQTIAALAVVI